MLSLSYIDCLFGGVADLAYARQLLRVWHISRHVSVTRCRLSKCFGFLPSNAHAIYILKDSSLLTSGGTASLAVVMSEMEESGFSWLYAGIAAA